MNKVIPILIFAVMFSLAACATPQKYTASKLPLCSAPSDTAVVKLNDVPYTKIDPAACAVSLKAFDVAVWNEAAYNSRKVRGMATTEIGCKPLTAATDNCSYCGPTGHSNTLMVNFDPTVFNEDITMRKAYLAVYTPDNPEGLNGVVLRGRLNIGDELQSLARDRQAIVSLNDRSGWVLYDVTFFVARAINERRNSIHFELSLPCQTPTGNLVRVGVTNYEPHLVVEYN